MEWIDATNNPPKIYRNECGDLIPFLAFNRGSFRPKIAFFDGCRWWEYTCTYEVMITHWMPLPEPPED